MPEQVSELTTNRLSVYLRFLNELDAAGVKSVSSRALAQQFHLNAAQIRKDLANFGDFGVRGVGEASIAPPPAAIACAIKNAVGVQLCVLPMRPDRILAALDDARAQEPVAAG